MNDTISIDERADAAGRGALWIGYGVILILALVGLFVGTRSSFYTYCVRPEAGAAVTCRVEQRWFGLVPFSVETVANVQSVGAGGYKTLPHTRAGRLQEDRREYNHLTLVGAEGEISISHELGSIIGVDNPELADRLDAFLHDPRAQEVGAWQVEWLPALVGAGFLFVPALVLLALAVQCARFVVQAMAARLPGRRIP